MRERVRSKRLKTQNWLKTFTSFSGILLWTKIWAYYAFNPSVFLDFQHRSVPSMKQSRLIVKFKVKKKLWFGSKAQGLVRLGRWQSFYGSSELIWSTFCYYALFILLVTLLLKLLKTVQGKNFDNRQFPIFL